MIIFRKLYSDSKKKDKFSLDPESNLRTQGIMYAGSLGGIGTGLAVGKVRDKYASTRIKKKAVKEFKKGLKKNEKEYEKGLKKLKKLAAKEDPNLTSEHSKKTLESLKKMRGDINKKLKERIRSTRNEELKKIGKNKLGKLLKRGMVGASIGSTVAAPFAIKYYKKKNPDRKFKDSDAASLGAMGGALASNLIKEKPFKGVDLKNLTKEQSKKIDKKIMRNGLKTVGMMVAGAGIGYGAKKLYDKHKNKKK